MFGTKCPSITSRWIQSAPAASTARTSSPSLAKSAARIDGAMTRGRDANCWDMCAFPNLLRGGTAPRNMGEGWGQCVRGRLLLAGKICRSGQLLPGVADRNGRGKAWFYWVFCMAWRLLRNMHELSAANGAALLEFCHVLCFGRCVVGDRCPQGADVVEVVVRAIHRPQPGRQEPVRPHVLGFVGFGRRGLGFRIRRRRFADIAPNHECAARRTEPVQLECIVAVDALK